MRAKFARLITVLCIVALMVVMIGAAGTDYVYESDAAAVGNYVEIPLYVNGVRVGSGLQINGTTYVPVIEFCEGLDRVVDVSWNEETATATARMDGLIVETTVGTQYVVANGRYFYARNGIRQVNGSVVVPVNELAEAFNVEVIWDISAWTIDVDTSTMSPITGAEEFYNEDDLYWLSHVINAESGNQPLEGKIAVGNVVLNRVEEPTCPDTVYDVIFDNKYGVQFSVTENGSIYLEPNEESVIAAKMCLEGCNIAGTSLFFVNPRIGATGWFAKNRTFVISIGDHDFYA